MATLSTKDKSKGFMRVTAGFAQVEVSLRTIMLSVYFSEALPEPLLGAKAPIISYQKDNSTCMGFLSTAYNLRTYGQFHHVSHNQNPGRCRVWA